MTVKVGGKTYKGKYRGPDQFKGDMTKVRADAAKRKIAKGAVNKAKTTTTSKTTPAAPTTPTTPGAPTVPNPGAVGSNSSGNVQLQSNIDIEQQAMDATQYLQQENERATQLRSQALLDEAVGQKNSRDAYQKQRGQTNATMAMRGMHGSAALNASAKDAGGFADMMNQVAANKAKAENEASGISTAAGQWKLNEDAKITMARGAYTDEQSKLNPTTGSSPVNSGLQKTTIPAVAKPAAKPAAKPVVKAAPKPVVKPKPKPKFKGKYPGPDKYKGNAKLIAAAKRKVVKK